jgi:hypothetical protein
MTVNYFVINIRAIIQLELATVHNISSPYLFKTWSKIRPVLTDHTRPFASKETDLKIAFKRKKTPIR